MRRRPQHLARTIAIVFVVLHSLWVLLVAALIATTYEGPGYQQELQGWILVAFPDLPVLWIVELLPGIWQTSFFSNVYYPAIALLFLGGIQWSVIGWVIGLVGGWAMRPWQRLQKDVCSKCGYPVGTSPVCTECGHPLTL